MKILTTLLLLGSAAVAQSLVISFDEERAKGNLRNDMPGSTLTLCGPSGCKAVGTFDENNIIHWNDSVTLDDLKAAMQAQADITQWRVNQYRKAHTDR